MARTLVALYTVLAIAAGARAAVQIATRWHAAPTAYLCSAGAAVVYLVIAVALRRPGARRLAVAGCALELAGVLGVGTATVADPSGFADQTVWSGYGAGYGWVPLALPPLALWWLARRRDGAAQRPGASAAAASAAQSPDAPTRAIAPNS